MQHVINALKYYGTSAIVGKEDNKDILKFFEAIGHNWVENDEVPWCAAFLNYILQVSGMENTRKLNARSFLEIGEKVTEPKIGDIAVFWRLDPQGTLGHVGIFVAQDEKSIFVLGGNQSNQVNIIAMPKLRLLSYQRLGYLKCTNNVGTSI